ncbi:CDP-diacylglycerol--serine O-phosphatidyltransferase, partial [Xanthomonas citri pv. citri]|nr:CDP-diacylglycerol--serine O-phosphatidyltransferase [Xanthomonas citri pv. citri]
HILQHDAVNRLDNVNRPKTHEIRPLIKAFRKYLSAQSYIFNGQPQSDQLSLSPLVGLGRKNALNKTIEALFYQVEDKLTICTPY